MNRFFALLLAAGLVLGGCESTPETAGAAAEATVADAAVAEAADFEPVGEAITAADAVPVQTVAAGPEAYLGQNVKLEGVVREVCQMKGCWLTLETESGTGVRVSVPKDDEGNYVYTFPTDVSGRRVIVEGWLEESTLDEETQRHLAEDAGQNPDEMDVAAKPELKLTARGALVQRL